MWVSESSRIGPCTNWPKLLAKAGSVAARRRLTPKEMVGKLREGDRLRGPPSCENHRGVATIGSTSALHRAWTDQRSLVMTSTGRVGPTPALPTS